MDELWRRGRMVVVKGRLIRRDEIGRLDQESRVASCSAPLRAWLSLTVIQILNVHRRFALFIPSYQPLFLFSLFVCKSAIFGSMQSLSESLTKQTRRLRLAGAPRWAQGSEVRVWVVPFCSATLCIRTQHILMGSRGLSPLPWILQQLLQCLANLLQPDE